MHLEAGASEKVRSDVQGPDPSMVTDAGDPIIAEGPYTITIGGGQPDTGAPVIWKFTIKRANYAAGVRLILSMRGWLIGLSFICGTGIVMGQSPVDVQVDLQQYAN